MVKKINETGALKKDIVKNLMTIWIMRFPGRILTPGWEAAASSLQLHNTNSGAICHVAASLLSSLALALAPAPPGDADITFQFVQFLFSALTTELYLLWVISTELYLLWVYSPESANKMHNARGGWLLAKYFNGNKYLFHLEMEENCPIQ